MQKIEGETELDYAERVVRELLADERKRLPRFIVYFIESPALGLIKIGWSRKPTKRLDDVRRSIPDELTVIATVRGGSILEGLIHSRCKALRKKGEWFLDTPELRDFIDRLQSGENIQAIPFVKLVQK